MLHSFEGRRSKSIRRCQLSTMPVPMILATIFWLACGCAAWMTPLVMTIPQRHRQIVLGYHSHPSNDESSQVEQKSTAFPSSVETKPPSEKATLKELVRSVNYFISRKCNYSCKFCFHTQKTTHHLTLEQARLGLALLQQAGTEKINFAGGEPFLHPKLLGELCRISSEEFGLAVSIISNGSLITQEWMQTYGRYVDVLGVSIDSFNDATNAAIGRGETSIAAGTSDSLLPTVKNKHVDRILQVREWCRQEDIIFKVNTVVCSLNWQEDMSKEIQQLDPQRWKVFQVLLLEDENVGEAAMRDARPLVVSDDQFQEFLRRHEHLPQLIPEPNDVMQNSYLLLDEDMRFLDCSGGGKVPGESILKVGVCHALLQAGFDHGMFQQRGGVYNWKRQRDSNEPSKVANG
ncbi:radical SAM superfamily protein [Nitzschia inconspicua]|uniref:Radical SAM superfamily protein n=1 Tax=Nitzschia inconspicua TaxID=303405 RepID=A0A9K3Q806_9STRA|nr:radical SAM superfamily protein [Nitzschia inconspicua]